MDCCSICLEQFSKKDIEIETNSILTLNCGHTYHKTCLVNILDNKCPYCRTIIDISHINKYSKVCANNKYHCEFGYSPCIKNGPCRFCFGKPLKYYINLL